MRTLILAALAAFFSSAHALTIPELNSIIDETNFIVGRGCSGTLISKEHRLVMTAEHCLKGDIRWVEKEEVIDGEVKKKKVEVRRDVDLTQVFYDGASKVGGSQYKAEILAYSDANEGADIALLRIRPKNIPMTREVPLIAKGVEALRGETVYVVGNPAGQEGSVTKGIIVSMNRENDTSVGNKVKMIQTDAEVFFGNSGGVLMNDEGKYLGTVSRGIPGTAVVFAIHYDHVQEMLSEACYGELYDPEAKSYEDCIAEREAKEEEEDETVKGLLKQILEKTSSPHE